MPASKGNQPVATFVKGLITETTPLTFPEGASLDEVNFKLKLDGSRERRLGVDLEDNYAYYDMGVALNNLPSASQRCFYWPSPNGSKKVDIGVVQLGRYIAFINLLTANPSANVLNGGATIDTGVDNTSPWQFAIINNYLLAVNAALKTPYLVSYDDVTDVISYETAPIKIRDLYGVADNIAVGLRPTTLTELHKYNLRNQGWSSNIVSTCGTDALDCTFTTFGVYPSNSDQWGIGRIGDLTDTNVDKYDPNIAARNIVDGGQVPRGTYIIDAFDRGADRNTLTGHTVPLDRETTYVSTVASYAGRAWYSGIRGNVVSGDARSPNLSNAILYSQIFRNKEDLVKCFQEADPTSYKFNEVVDTDGGVVHIPEAVNIVRLKAVHQSLFVFARNGVWEIRGGQDGFTATVFQVNKISSVGVYSPDSIVEANGTIMFWAIEGIYSITPNPQNPGAWDTNNVTLPTIQKYYNNIPDVVKRGAKGFYDFAANQCRWLFTSDYPRVMGDPLAIPIIGVGNILNVEITGRFVKRVNVTSLDETTYVVVCTTTGVYTGGTFGDIRAFIVKTSGANSTTVTAYTPADIDVSGKLYSYVSATKLTASRFLISAYDDTNDDVRTMVCTVSGTTITVQSNVASETTAVNTLGVMVQSIRIDDTRFIQAWYTSTTGYVSGKIGTVATDHTITYGATVTLVDYAVGQLFWIEPHYGVADTYSIFALDAAAVTTNLFTISGSVITPVSAGATIGHYTGSSLREMLTLSNVNVGIVMSNSSTLSIELSAINLTTHAEINQISITNDEIDGGGAAPTATLVRLTNNKFGLLYHTNARLLKMRTYIYAAGAITYLGDEEIPITTAADYTALREGVMSDRQEMGNGRVPCTAVTYNYPTNNKQYATTFIYNKGV